MKKNQTREQLLIEINQLESKLFELERDSTKQKKVNKKNKKHERIINRSRDAVYKMKIPSGVYSFMSSAAKQVFGYDADEFMDNSIKINEIIAPDWKEYFKEKWGDLIKGKVPGFYEYQIVDNHGELRWIHQLNRAVFNKDKKIIAIEGICRDITNQKNVLEYLKESEEKHRFLFDNTTQGVVYQNSTGKIIYANKSAETILGISLDQMQGRTNYDPRWKSTYEDGSNYPGEQHPAMISLKTGQTILNAKMCVFNPINNTTKIININALPKFKDNEVEPHEVVTIFEDISEIRKAEQTIKENEAQLKELIIKKDKLYSLISHDLRSPFNYILGYSELLINSINTQNIDETIEHSKIINSTAKNTLDLLDNLLDWSKSQSGKINFSLEKLNISTIIDETIYTLDSSAKSKNISINHNKSDDFEVFSDINLLKTVLRNLISNAIKFTNSNGKIAIYSIQSQNMLEVTISDNGIGMNKEKCDKLFNTDLGLTTLGTAGEKGSGLGLLLCKEFVEKQGGRIWVESKVGEGSDFKFTLPLKLKAKKL